MTQEQALKTLKQGHNVFLTGPAGSGKTFLLNKYIKYLRGQDKRVAVTASTGIAATHIGGVTIHSWSGIGIKKELAERDLEEMLDKDYLHDRFYDMKVLIIDEVSMLPAYVLDLVDKVCRNFKKNGHPFGGFQVVLCGDFFQLPPVADTPDRARFVFESMVWSNMDIKICYLQEQHRQKNDDGLLNILNEIRTNSVSPESKKKLLEEREMNFDHVPRLPKLYATNRDVDKMNDFELEQLNEENFTFKMKSEGIPSLVDTLKRSCLAHETLNLKIGALVMFIRNKFVNEKPIYVNGTLGIVEDFTRAGSPIIKTRDGDIIEVKKEEWSIQDGGEIIAQVIQYPLRLAWAITIHKSQGMSLDCAEIDLSRCFTKGMGYVALSRVRSLSGLKLLGINDLALKTNEDIVEVDKRLVNASNKIC